MRVEKKIEWKEREKCASETVVGINARTGPRTRKAGTPLGIPSFRIVFALSVSLFLCPSELPTSLYDKYKRAEEEKQRQHRDFY